MAPVFAALVTYKDEDYLGAKEECVKGLERQPDNPWLMGVLSACHICLGDYESSQALTEPLLALSEKLPPQTYAAVQNNVAVALWLRNFNTPEREASLTRADALTADA